MPESNSVNNLAKNSINKLINKKGPALVISILCLYIVVQYNACGEGFQAFDSLNGSSLQVQDGPVVNKSFKSFQETLHPVLSQQCASCHGGGIPPLFAVSSDDGTDSFNFLSGTGLVNRADPAQSVLVTKLTGAQVTASHASFGPVVAKSIEDAARDWVAERIPSEEIKLTSLQAFEQVMKPRLVSCSGCHANTSPRVGNANLQLAHDEAVSVVNFGSPTLSILVTETTPGNGIGSHDNLPAGISSEITIAITEWNNLRPVADGGNGNPPTVIFSSPSVD